MLLPSNPSKTAGLPASYHTESTPCTYKVKQNININLAVLILNSDGHKESYNKNGKIGGNLSRRSVSRPCPNTNFSIVIAQKGCKATPQRQLIISRKLAKQPY
jgi:hypothetical protein